MTNKNRTGSEGALGQAILSLEDRLRQLQSITPGVDGGGRVATPFTIGDYTFGVGEQINLQRLAEITSSRKVDYQPLVSIVSVGTGGSTVGYFSVDYNMFVDFECITTLGASPDVRPTGPTWTVPLEPDPTEYIHAIGNSIGYDATGGLQDFRTIMLTGLKVEPRFTTTTPGLAQISATTPITWAVNDRFYIRGRYRASVLEA